MNQKEVKVTQYTEKNTRTILRTDTIVDSIIDSFVERAMMGKEKYNTDMDRQDLSLLDWIEHLQGELKDALVYTEKIKETVQKLVGKNKI